ncbi:hypothetical protein VCHA50P417_20488 [Vibrio chagasii]|nr:hypothetical protein VCHA50P417_20488 [Vibrio chagasii]
MHDGFIVTKLMGEIENQLAQYGLTDFRVSRSQQPTNQHVGAVTGTEKYQIFISQVNQSKLGYGWSYSAIEGKEALKQTSRHKTIKRYQIDLLVDFDPRDTTVIPAYDLAEDLSNLLQHPDSVAGLLEDGIGIVSCSDVRPEFTINESDLTGSTPSFDITINYAKRYEKEVGTISNVKDNIKGI